MRRSSTRPPPRLMRRRTKYDPSTTRRPRRLALPDQVNERVRFVNRATSRLPTTLRPADCWKTSTVTGRDTFRLKLTRSPCRDRLTPAVAKPAVVAHRTELPA